MIVTLLSQLSTLQVDWKSAYRRVHLVADTAVQSIIAIFGMLLLALRFTFGGTTNPSHWSNVSEIATDLANDLVCHPNWLPSIHHSEHQHLLLQAHDCDLSLDPIMPFGEALPLGVFMMADDNPKYNCYIDDVFGCFLAEHADRGEAIAPLVLSLFGRPTPSCSSRVSR
jgi:hypothetical protein